MKMNNRFFKDDPEKTPEKKPYKNDPYGHDPKGLDIQGFEDCADLEDCADIRAASATDCTGLIPALPTSDSELESYAQVYHYPADIFQD